jgi:phage antirepressor YoqD-like protein
MNNLIVSNNQATMSSHEITVLTGKEHGHVLRDIRKMLAELYPELDSFESKGIFLTPNKNGQSGMIYLPKREALILTSGYSIIQRAKIIDRWQELEAKQQFNIPTTLSGALRLAASQAELLEVQTQIIEQQKPAVHFVERYVESSGNKGFREVCKLLKAKENQFREFLLDKKIMYRLGGNLTPYGDHLDAGRFETNAGISAGEHAYTQAKFTPKGINWVAGLWAVYNLESAMAEAA